MQKHQDPRLKESAQLDQGSAGFKKKNRKIPNNKQSETEFGGYQGNGVEGACFFY